LSIHLESQDLVNAQQMEVAVHGPDGATHLILCTGVAHMGTVNNEAYTFLVGPKLSRRQFVRAIASGALSSIQAYDKDPSRDHIDVELGANLDSIDADFDDQSGHVQVKVEVSSSNAMIKLAVSYNVNILAELAIR